MKLGKLSSDISGFEKSLNAANVRVFGGFGTMPNHKVSQALVKIKQEDKLGEFLTKIKSYERKR